jgi:hypothetical protein
MQRMTGKDCSCQEIYLGEEKREEVKTKEKNGSQKGLHRDARPGLQG